MFKFQELPLTLKAELGDLFFSGRSANHRIMSSVHISVA